MRVSLIILIVLTCVGLPGSLYRTINGRSAEGPSEYPVTVTLANVLIAAWQLWLFCSLLGRI